jgi:hypothetical protein
LVEGSAEAGEGVQEDDDVLAEFDAAFAVLGGLEGDLDVLLGAVVVAGGDDGAAWGDVLDAEAADEWGVALEDRRCGRSRGDLIGGLGVGRPVEPQVCRSVLGPREVGGEAFLVGGEGSAEIGDLLGPLVDQQHDEFEGGVVAEDGEGDVFEQGRLAGFGR